MEEETQKPDGLGPREMLAEIDSASTAMVGSTEAPRSLMFTLLALLTTVITLLDVVSWPMILGLFTLFIPLGLWYHLLMRNRPKARTVLNHSGPYIGYGLLFGLVMQCSRFWEVESWAEGGAKWLVVFGILGFCMSGMRTATIKNRLKDANERPL